MSETTSSHHPGRFFAIGPLRTGSSLMARCLDDHPDVICLCESEINRTLFPEYYLKLHFERMRTHGFTPDETVRLLDRKKQDEIGSLLGWYSDISPRLGELYGKLQIRLLGDKSPDFFRIPELVHHLVANYPLIYTVRDPRAILWSIERQDDTQRAKAVRWDTLAGNYAAWRPHLDAPNVLAVRYEDLVANPVTTMQHVYTFLGLSPSSAFLEPFERRFPGRFLWETAVDWETGIRKDFDPARASSWREGLARDRSDRVFANPVVAEFTERFGYER